MSTTSKFLNTILLKAIELAKTSQMDQKHSAIMFRQGKIYSYGINSNDRTHMFGCNYPCIHAEMDCINRSSLLTRQCLLRKKREKEFKIGYVNNKN